MTDKKKVEKSGVWVSKRKSSISDKKTGKFYSAHVVDGRHAHNIRGEDRVTAVKILGIKGAVINSPAGMIQTVRKGIPMRALRNLMAHTHITMDEMADYTHTTSKILSTFHSNKKLNPELSERTVEIASLYSKGEDVFGDKDRFNAWMSQPSIPLGDKRPKDYLDTSFGIQLLMDELGRIEHGIFA